MAQGDSSAITGRWKRAVRVLLGVDTAVFDALVSVMRGVFFRFLLLTAIVVVPMLLVGETPPAWRAAAAVLLGGLVAWWLRGLRRGAFPGWALPLEGLALAALCVSVADPPRMLGVLYISLNFRALFGSARSAAALAVTYMAAFLGAVAGAGALGYALDATHLSEPGIIAQVPGFAVTVAVVRMLVAVAVRQEQREARFRSLVANANDVIRVLDADGTIVHESAAVRRVLGYEPADVIGHSAFELMHPGDVAEMRRLFMVILDNPGDMTVATECRLRHADGSWRNIEGTIRNLLADPAVAGFVVNYRDITQRKQLEAELRHRALHEPLTELPNRALFHDRVDQALRHAADGATVAVIFLDLDDFKQVNDGLGHAAGDAVLRAVAERLRAVVEPTDTCARLGGDEFGVLLTGPRPPADVDRVAAAILQAIQVPVDVAGNLVTVDASLGIAVHSAGETADDLVHNADLAMYRAKSTGKARAEHFEAGMHEAVRRRIELKEELERAITAGEFVAHYQPVVDLGSDRVVAVETLVRWDHPRHGLLAPDAFLTLAEHSGLIVPIGRQIIAQACRDVAAWRSAHGDALTLTVNLSARELGAPDLTDFLAATMRAHGIDPRCVIVEVTESMLLLDTAAAARTLAQLAQLGVRVALDDFGTGFSSLAYLQQLPVDVVKVDKSFVDSLGGGAAESPLAAAILALCRVLGLAVTAEGVETRVQLDRLRALGCDEAQGYYFCRPLPAAAAHAFVRTWAGHAADAGSRVGV